MPTEAVETQNGLMKTWIAEVIKLLDDQEIVQIAQMIKPQIDGFGPRSTHKAPIAILRKKTLEKLKSVKKLEEFFGDFYKPFLQQLKTVTDSEERLTRIYLNSHIKPAGTVFLLAKLDPDFLDENQDTVRQNLKHKKDPLEGLVDSISFSKEAEILLQSFTNLTTVETRAALQELFLQQEDYAKLESGDMTLSEYLTDRPISDEKGHYLLLAAITHQEWSTWEDSKLLGFLRFVHYDACRLILSLEQNDNALKSEIVSFEDKLAVLNERREKEKQAQLKKETGFTQQIKILQQQLAEERSRVVVPAPTLAPEPRLITPEPLVIHDSFRIITFQSSRSVAPYIANTALIYCKNVSQLDKVLPKHADERILWFIDVDGCTVKDTFHIESSLKRMGRPYRLVSGEYQTLVRKIIFHLEGDLSYETH